LKTSNATESDELPDEETEEEDEEEEEPDVDEEDYAYSGTYLALIGSPSEIALKTGAPRLIDPLVSYFLRSFIVS